MEKTANKFYHKRQKHTNTKENLEKLEESFKETFKEKTPTVPDEGILPVCLYGSTALEIWYTFFKDIKDSDNKPDSKCCKLKLKKLKKGNGFEKVTKGSSDLDFMFLEAEVTEEATEEVAKDAAEGAADEATDERESLVPRVEPWFKGDSYANKSLDEEPAFEVVNQNDGKWFRLKPTLTQPASVWFKGEPEVEEEENDGKIYMGTTKRCELDKKTDQ